MAKHRQVIEEEKITVPTTRDKLHRDKQKQEALSTKKQATPQYSAKDTNRPVLLYAITQALWEDPQKYVYELAEYFAQDYEVHVVYGSFEYTGHNVFREELEKHGVVVHTIDSLRAKNILTHEVRSLVSFYKLIREIQPDIVHTNDGKTSLLLGLARMLGPSSRQIATLHSIVDPDTIRSYELGIWKFVTKLSFGMAERIITRNEHIFEQAKELFGEKYVQLVLPGLREIEFVDPEQKLRSLTQSVDSALAKRLRDPETVLLGNIAALEADQGISFVLQAISELKSRGKKIVYIHYGEGSQRKLLEREVEQFGLDDCVVFKGLDKLAHRYLPMFDIVVHPVLRPGLSELVRNAGLAKRALITTAVLGVKDKLTHEKDALLLKPKHAQELERAIDRLAEHPEERRKLGVALEQRIRAEYSSGDMLRETRTLYNLD